MIKKPPNAGTLGGERKAKCKNSFSNKQTKKKKIERKEKMQQIEIEGFENLEEALKHEPENIKQIITDFVKETLEQYKEAMFATGLKRRGTVDLDDDLVRCDFVLPDLIRWGSYKSFGLRYYTFEAKISTHYGKEWDILISVICNESIYDRFCATLNSGEKIIAYNWAEPLAIRIDEVNEFGSYTWKTVNEREAELNEALKEQGVEL